MSSNLIGSTTKNLPCGVTGNTSDSGSEESRFEPWRGSQIQKNYNRLRTSTGIVISTNAWDESKELATRKDINYTAINSNLKLIKSRVEAHISNLKVNRLNISFDEFKNGILEIINPDKLLSNEKENESDAQSELPPSFLDEFQRWIEKRKSSNMFAESTIKRYWVTYNKLSDYSRKKRTELKFEIMDKHFYTSFMTYLNQNGLVNNSAGVHIKVLKTFLYDIEEEGKAVNKEFRQFKSFKDPEPPTFALTDKEIEAIENVIPTNKRLEKTKDLFMIQLHTLFRVSDLMNIKREHIDTEKMTIKFFIQKTRRSINVPITRKVLEVLQKYDYEIPRISSQKYNDNLKELAKMAGIDKMVELARTKGAKKEVEVLPKYETMSSNVVRRSGITGLLRRKVPPKMIMQVSGHKKLQVFERYIRMEEQESLDAVRNAWDAG